MSTTSVVSSPTMQGWGSMPASPSGKQMPPNQAPAAGEEEVGIEVRSESTVTAPLYAAAGGFSVNDMVDLNEIFADDFLIPGMVGGGFSPFGGYTDDLGDSSSMGGGGGDRINNVEGGMTSSSLSASSSSAGPSGLQALRGRRQGGITARLGTKVVVQPQPSRGRTHPREEEEVEEEEEEEEEEEDEDDNGLDSSKKRKKAKLTMKPLTEQQRVERRERNREHAKRSRMRKKFMLESLQAQMLALRKENLRLRQVVTTKIPEKADQILRGCSSIKTQNMMSPVELGHHRPLADTDGKLITALQFAQQNFTVSDPSLPDNPIVYASQGFLQLTGYRADQIIGRNCRFLQGPGTDPAAVDIIRRGVANGEDTSVCLLNYRADGTPFWNQFFVAALRDSDGNIVNYVGVQCEVAEAPMEEELKERVKTINFDVEEG